MREIQILIMHDSLYMREMLQSEMEKDINFKVIAKTSGLPETQRRMAEYEPRVVIAEVNPEIRLDPEGVVQTLLQPGVVLITVGADPALAAPALGSGAAAFKVKPAAYTGEASAMFFHELRYTVKQLLFPDTPFPSVHKMVAKTILIGASTGGAEAIEALLRELPPAMPPVVIAQHMPAKYTATFASRLNTLCDLSVKEAQSGDFLIPGQVYISPGGRHTTLRLHEFNRRVVCSENTLDIKTCPNINLLFHSATAFAKDCIGVLLTGMGKDGAEGLKALRDKGCRTVVQDQASCVVYGMPKAAFDIGAATYQLPLRQIPRKLAELAVY